MQTLLRDSAAGLMHSMMYFGFLVLVGVTTVLEVDHQLPEDLKFLHGRTYQAYAFVGDAAGIVFLTGVCWAIVRRYVQRPYRIRIKSKVDHVLALGSLFLIGVTGFAAEMFRIARDGAAGNRHELGEVQLHRLPAVEARRRPQRRHARELASVHVGRPRAVVRRCSWRSCRSRCCATCSRRR